MEKYCYEKDLAVQGWELQHCCSCTLLEPVGIHKGLGGLLPPCFQFLWMHLQGLTHLPHTLDSTEISVIAVLG